VIRAARDEDAPGIIALIAACWSEYPGCVMDLDGEAPELRALATYYAGKGGRAWVAEIAGEIVGTIGVAPVVDDAWQIGKMYVAREHRGSGLAQYLLAGAENHAVWHGARRIVLWTDTRFARAHRFYAARGYVSTGESRELYDLSETVEYAFEKHQVKLVSK